MNIQLFNTDVYDPQWLTNGEKESSSIKECKVIISMELPHVKIHKSSKILI